jgi:hypothetical protein
MKTKKQAIPTPSLSRQGIINKLLCVLMLAMAASISLPSFADTKTANVSTYTELQAAIADASVNVIVVTANIDVPCETSVTSTSNPDYTGASTAQLVINRSLTLQSQAGNKYTIKRIAANEATTDHLKSLISIRGNGNGTSGTANLTENTVEVTFTNIIIDGGADWGTSTVSERRTAATTAYGNAGRSMIDVFMGGILNLEDGVVLQNGFTTYSINSVVNNSGSYNYGGAVRVEYDANYGGGTVNLKAGATIHDCSAQGGNTAGYGGALGAYNFARLNVYGGTIYNCSAASGGAIGCTWRNRSDHATSGTINLFGGTIHDCYANKGGAILTEGTVEDYLLGGTISNCSAKTEGGAIAIPEKDTKVHIVVYTSNWLTISDCSPYVEGTASTGDYPCVSMNAEATISTKPVCQVTFRNNNTDFAVLHVLKDNSLGEAFPAAPVNADFRFVGWYNGNTEVTKSTVFTGNTTVTAKWDFLGNGTSTDPYLIPSADVWDFLADQASAGNTYYDKYFQLTEDISVTTMVGSSEKPFSGIFDGNGHTLTVTYNTTEGMTGPFRCARGTTIMNLHTAGTITTSGKFAGGLIGFAYNANTITNCRSSVYITSSVSGDGTHGGFIGDNESSESVITSFEGCVFDGKLLGSNTDCCGGFVGWCSGNVRLSLLNNLYAPQQVTISTSSSQTFSRTGSELLNNLFSSNTNSFYSEPLGGAQGKQTRTISAGDDVTISGLGDGTEYNVSGITSYGTGIKYGGKLYAGDGDAVSLTLSHADAPEGHTFGGYTASSGTLSGSDNPYSLTMPASDVTITAVWTPITVTLFAAGATNEWMTWCGEDVYDVPEGCAAYEVTGVSNGAVTLSDALTTIPAYTPVLIHRTAGELTSDITAEWKAEGTAPTSGYNSTTGIVTAEIAANSITFYGNAGDETQTHNPYATGPDPEHPGESIPVDDQIPALTKATGLTDGWACYILRDGNFVFVDTDRGIAAHRCVLAVKTSSLGGNAGARVLTIGTETTDITTTDFTDKADAWYSIDGRKLEGKPTRRGIYVNGGRKVVIR